MPDDAVLELRGITKQFPGTLANDHIDLDVQKGEVHALLGENGAGKSTLMNILYGLYHPDEGEIRIRGQRVSLSSPKDAIAHGIGMVHQHFMLIPVMTVAENIVLATEPTTAGIFILDEPTAVLTPQEAHELFEILNNLRTEGLSIIFISHKLNEVLEIADRVTVLRRGKKIETLPREGATEKELARLMVGREVLLRVDKAPASPTEPLLSVEDLHVVDDRGLEAVRGVSFQVRAGEIVGLAGVDGNGQTELIDALAGLRHSLSGRIVLAGKDVTRADARDVLDRGLGHIPEDRQRRGLVLDFTLAENLGLHDYRKEPNSRFGWLFPNRLVRWARRLLEQYDVL